MNSNSYTGNILKVDLSKGSMVNLPTNDYTDRFIGGWGLAAKLWDTVPPDTGAFDPGNCLIFATRKLTNDFNNL
jgi:aldehyde:ferredoxin oxidoreductase